MLPGPFERECGTDSGILTRTTKDTENAGGEYEQAKRTAEREETVLYIWENYVE